ncbi:hypothetical protein GBW32_14575 [Streptomyces tsukubensis]|nr:hypothetical protein GBW32_14575 [Streptomyces tsukubensis]
MSGLDPADARRAPRVTVAAEAPVHESYSFACMRCGHGWEQSYEITHHEDAKGNHFVVYLAGGARVPSPLTQPSCQNCGGGVVRIMNAGRVASASATAHGPAPVPTPASAASGEGSPSPGSAGGAENHPHHHWHLSDLLHPFHHRHETG